MTSCIITFNNKEIYEFYQSNPNLNIETLNLILINLLKEMGTDLTKTISSTVIGEILNNVKDIKNNMTNLSDQLSLKLHEHNKSFLDTTKLIINASSSENADKIINLLNRNIDDFVNKINTIIPKTHQEQILILQKTIQDDLKTFVKSNSGSESDSLNKEFLTTIESKILSIQQPIFSFIHNNNEQISQKLTNLSDDKQSNNKTMRELDNYLNKFNNSSQFKVNISEIKLSDVLHKLYKKATITDSRRDKNAGDFILERENKNTILIENKRYETQHVPAEETNKFLRDCKSQNMNGLMISQHSGFANKNNFEIDINENKVLLYITYVDYNPDIIESAVNLIDNLSEKIQELEIMKETDGFIIDKATLDNINKEYQDFLTSKLVIITNIKTEHKKLIHEIEKNLSLPNISLYLSGKYASVTNKIFECDECDATFPTQKGLNGHKNVHAIKQDKLSDASSETSDKPSLKMRKNKSKVSAPELTINTK
jgi:hypothetical protein